MRLKQLRLAAVARLRQFLHRPERGQELVEFGLIIAVVSLAGVAGLRVLGRAEEGYFIPISDQMADQHAPTGSGDPIHYTSLSMNCTPSLSPIALTANLTRTSTPRDQVSCDMALTDLGPTKQYPPTGTIIWTVDGTPWGTPCTLTPKPGSDDTSICPAPLDWIPVESDISANAHKLAPTVTLDPSNQYQQAPATVPTLTVWVEPRLDFSTQCTAAWSVGSAPSDVEVGHPIWCTVTALDRLHSTPYTQPVSVLWSALTDAMHPAGTASFACLTGAGMDDYSGLKNPNICGRPGPNGACTTDPNNGGTCTLAFRRNYSDALGTDYSYVDYRDPDQFTFSGLPSIPYGPGGPPPVAARNQNVVGSGAPPSVTPSQPPHGTVTVVSCGASTTAWQTTLVHTIPAGFSDGSPPLTLPSAATVQRNASVRCQIAVADTDVNPAFDSIQCQPRYGDVHWCYADFATAHPPLGTVTLTDDLGNPIPGGSCQLNHEDVPGNGRPTGTSQVSGPGLIPPPLYGQQEYASWCTVTVNLLTIAQFTASYGGEPDVNPGHIPSAAPASSVL